MRSSRLYILVFAVLAIFGLSACDELSTSIWGEAGNGQPVQVHLEIPDTLALQDVSIDEVSISLSNILISSARSDFSFELADSTVVLFPEDPSAFVAEKVVAEDSYNRLLMEIAGFTDSNSFSEGDLDPGAGTGSTLKTTAFESNSSGAANEGKKDISFTVSGLFMGEPFTFAVSDTMRFDLNISPPLQVVSNTESIIAVTVFFDFSTWFTDKSGQILLDPRIAENHEQIIANIRQSLSLKKKEDENDGPGVEKRVSIGITGDQSINEDEGPLIFEVSLNKQIDDSVFVNYATSDNSAKAGEDYVANSGRLIFEPGEISRNVEVEIIKDQIVEHDEAFLLILSDPGGNADIDSKKKRAKGIILNDDNGG